MAISWIRMAISRIKMAIWWIRMAISWIRMAIYWISKNGYLVDKNGYLVDKNGYLADKNGNLADKNGYLVDNNGYLVDEFVEPLTPVRVHKCALQLHLLPVTQHYATGRCSTHVLSQHWDSLGFKPNKCQQPLMAWQDVPRCWFLTHPYATGPVLCIQIRNWSHCTQY